MSYPELNLNGQLVSLGAVDDPGRWLHLDSGRLPEQCDPERCEVIQAGGDRVASVAETGVRLVVVGRASGPLPFDLTTLSAAAHGQTKTPPVLIAGNVQELSTLPVFSAIFRRYGWTSPIRAGTVHDWDVPGLLRRESAASQELERAGGAFGLGAPDTALEEAHSSAQVAARRLLLVGGAAAALLVGFVLLAAGGLRRDSRAEFARLARHGARAWQVRLQAAVEAAWVTGLGVAAGAAIAAGAIAYAAREARRRGVGGAPPLARDAGRARAPARALGRGRRAGGRRRAGRRRVRPARPSACARPASPLAAVAAAVLAASRGSSTEASLASGSDPLLALLPGLAAVAAGARRRPPRGAAPSACRTQRAPRAGGRPARARRRSAGRAAARRS